MSRKSTLDSSLTSLKALISAGDLEGVKAILEGDDGRKAASTALNTSDWYPIHEACDIGELDIVVELVKYGADVNEQDDLWQTPLMLAMSRGYAEVANALIGLGADCEAVDSDGWSIPCHAASGGDIRALRLLVEHNVSFARSTETNYGKNMLQLPISGASNSAEVLRFLVAHGVNIHHRDILGNAVLEDVVMFSKDDNWSENVKTMLDAGCDPCVRSLSSTRTGSSLLNHCAMYGKEDEEQVGMLLDAGASPHTSALDGKSCLSVHGPHPPKHAMLVRTVLLVKAVPFFL